MQSVLNKACLLFHRWLDAPPEASQAEMLVCEFGFSRTHAESLFSLLLVLGVVLSFTQVFAVAAFSSPEGKRIELSKRRYVDNKKKIKHFPPLKLNRKRRIQIKPSKNIHS